MHEKITCDMHTTIKFLPHFFIKKHAKFRPIFLRTMFYTFEKV